MFQSCRFASTWRRRARTSPLIPTAWWVLLAALFLASGCVSITDEPRALLLRPDGEVQAKMLTCATADRLRQRQEPAGDQAAIDPNAIRMVSWNIHKQADPGWQHDLARFAQDNHILLLQEVSLERPLRQVIEDARFSWVMASSFMLEERDTGVLTAARIAPLASCTQRSTEPLLRLPKSAVITWFPLANRAQTLAVVNIHAINFTVWLQSYQAQLNGLADALATHDGPIIFAGDLNTWRDGRTEVVAQTAAKLGLVELKLGDDQRTLFYGRKLDHVWVRGLEMIDSKAIPVTSSDHNPVLATLRVADGPIQHASASD